MVVLPQPWEDREPYKSLYTRAVNVIRDSFAPGYVRHADGNDNRWALRYLSYDWLTLMNTATTIELGGWDTIISYYSTDCDMYERMRMASLATMWLTRARSGGWRTTFSTLVWAARLIPQRFFSGPSAARVLQSGGLALTANSCPGRPGLRLAKPV